MRLEREQIAALTAHFRRAGSPYADIRSATLLKGGQSNPTVRLDTSSGPVVVRARPLNASPWAHDIRREFRVLGALSNTPVPVPHVHMYCDDETVIGGAFYLMEFVDGRIVDDCRLPGMTPVERRAIYRSFTSAFAALHAVDPMAIGLGDFGKPDSFVLRQIKLHARNFREYEPAGNADFDWLAENLPGLAPPQTTTSVIHNDIRVGNVVLHPTEPHVIAILDWELSTLGDPLADAALIALPHEFPTGNPQGTFAEVDPALGIPSARELLAWYCADTGRATFPNAGFYAAFNLFRYASVYAGIAARFRQGIAVSADAPLYAAMVAPTLKRARALVAAI